MIRTCPTCGNIMRVGEDTRFFICPYCDLKLLNVDNEPKLITLKKLVTG